MRLGRGTLTLTNQKTGGETKVELLELELTYRKAAKPKKQRKVAQWKTEQRGRGH